MNLRTYTLSLALVSSLASCGARTVVPFVDSPLTPEEVASRRVERAAERGASAALEVRELRLRARYNPAPCDCPAWEVETGVGWERVELRAARDAEPGLDAVLHGTGIAESATLVITATRTDEAVVSPSGRPWAIVEVLALQPDTETP